MTTETAEQPADWTEPGPHTVVPGVHRIPLPLPLTGLTAVNAYLLEGPDGLILIDPGWASPANEEAIAAALHALGHQLSDLTTCLATHHHWDHYTQAYAWRDTLRTRLLVGREEHHSIGAYGQHSARFPMHPELLDRCGAPELAARLQTEEPPEHEKDVPYGLPDGWLEHGERIPLAHDALEVIATPGHTRGHIVYQHSAAGVLFSGDHVLPTITPSLGFEMSPAPRPLRSFLSSLRLLLNQPDAALLPAHGLVTTSTHSRVRELLDHHQQRLDEVEHILMAGATTAYDVAARLPWTRHRRRLDHLALEHQMSAVMEIEAHLDVLSMTGRVTSTNNSAVRRYSARSRSSKF
ncbi:MBL fold metallo-hydrolase [Saccharopolyspora terrae]|uniref:MBL fold metallo-hydrolase n=1 Tax=Saccharopolyspora terrae TaxID=2530384 RepID=A0A4R4VIZ5_9PSEU|nr:MBL fold metallo-hydrolase [Saccharopolyspora terrae]TDD03777.1 MBL fold metallo-hydrolase [Saccharopolyspora terrae]